MKPADRHASTASGPRPALLLALLLAFPGVFCATAWAQYKVVQPDGSTTYTDRPPAPTSGRVTSLNRKGTSLPADLGTTNAGLPNDLRQATQRHPVTLYAGAECPPCDNGRRFLQQRGIPFSEKRVATEEDAVALEKVLGVRTLPGLSIGTQPLRGFSDNDWSSYLDAAGYPRESKLPKNWVAQPPQPLAERAAAKAAPRVEDAPVVMPELPSASVGTRF